jgi:hypothetical protein
MSIGNSPNVTTVPATPTPLLAATTKATTLTLTTPPSAPGQFLVFTLASNTVAGTITLSGLDNYNAAASETINVSASQTTVYSTRRYSSLTSPGSNQFATTGLSTGATITVAGVYGWTYGWTYDGINNYTPYSATMEIFNGVFGYKLPYAFFSDITFDWQKTKELAITAKGEAQDYLVVGDPNPTTYPSGQNPFATLAQPTSLPMVSWPGSFYVDAGTSTPLTTQDGSLLTFKAQINTGRKSYYSGDGQQRWSSVTWTAEPSVALDATVVLQNQANYLNYFKQNQAMIFGAMFQGNPLGGGFYENWTFTFPCRVDTDKNDPSKNPVEGTLKFISEYSFLLGYAFKLAITCQVPPTYAQ